MLLVGLSLRARGGRLRDAWSARGGVGLHTQQQDLLLLDLRDLLHLAKRGTPSITIVHGAYANEGC